MEKIKASHNDLSIDEIIAVFNLCTDLCRMRQEECKQLSIEHLAPTLLHNLLSVVVLLKSGILAVPDAEAEAVSSLLRKEK